VVWDVETGQSIRRFEIGDIDTLTGLRIGPTDLAAAVSPDGRTAMVYGETTWCFTMWTQDKLSVASIAFIPVESPGWQSARMAELPSPLPMTPA